MVARRRDNEFLEATMIEALCLMCGQSDVVRLSSRGQYNDPVNAALCQHDGFVYLSPRMDVSGYADYYAGSNPSMFQPAWRAPRNP